MACPVLARDVYFDHIYVDVNINPDSSLNVSEEQNCVFTGDYSGGFTVIELKGLDNITDFKVNDDGMDYVQSTDDDKYQFNVYDDSGYRIVKWRSRSTDEAEYQNTAKTFTISYKVLGALNHTANFDYLYWKAIFEQQRDGVVNHVRVRVHFPQAIDPKKLSVALYTTAKDSKWEILDPKTIELTGENLDPSENLEFRAEFPVGITDLSIPLYKQEVPVFATFVFPLVTLLLMLLLYLRFGHDYGTPEVKKVLTEMPSDLTAALVGNLVNEKAELREVVAAVLNLASRGYIKVTELSNNDYDFRLEKPTVNLAEHEMKIMKHIFNLPAFAGTTIRLNDLVRRIATFLPDVEEAIYEDAVRMGYFSENPMMERMRYYVVGGFLFVAGLAAAGYFFPPLMERLIFVFIFAGIPSYFLFETIRKKQFVTVMVLCALASIGVSLGFLLLTTYLLENDSSFLTSAIVASALSGTIVLIFSGSMPKKRLLRSKERSQWLAFKNYLGTKESAPKAGEYLPYAVALGIHDRYLSVVHQNAPGRIEWFAPSGEMVKGLEIFISKLFSSLGESGKGAGPVAP